MNDYYTPGTAIQPYTTAKAADVVAEFAAVELGFDRVESVIDGLLGNITLTSLMAANVPPTFPSIHVTGYTTAGDGGAALWKRAAVQAAGNGKRQSADGAWWEIAETDIYVEMLGALGGSANDSAAFTECMAIRERVMCHPNRTYKVKDVAIPTATTLDLNDAVIQPYAGAASCFTATGGLAYPNIRNGEFTDPTNITLRSTTLTAGILAGATSIAVASAADFTDGELIVIVADDVDDEGKARVHYTLIDSIVGTTITLKDAFPWTAAASGNSVMTSRGMIRFDGPDNYELNDLRFTLVPLGIVLRGDNLGTIASGKAVLRGLRFGSYSLGAISVGHDSRVIHYEDIIGYANAPEAWRAGFGLYIDCRDSTTGDNGDHMIGKVNFLGGQDCFAFQNALYVFLNSTVADNCRRSGILGGNGSEIYIGVHASGYVGQAVTLTGNSQAAIGVLRARTAAPWSSAYDIEVEDGSIAYLNNSTFYGTRTIRNTAGWSSENVYTSIGQEKLEDGSVALPSLSFRKDPDTGFYRAASGDVRFVSNGVAKLIFDSAGLAASFGTLAAPSLSFSGDRSTGFYRAASGEIRQASNGAVAWAATAARFAPAGVLQKKTYTVATLPAGTAGDAAFVSDANATLAAGIGAVVVGGGANNVPVHYDGSAWRIG